jgi:hypothetical protein
VRAIPNRYNTAGPWFKGNTHIHTTYSDGARDYRQVAELYASRGYDFIFVTDHNHVADIEDRSGLPLLALNGIEVDGKDRTGAWFHVVGLGYRGNDAPDGAIEDQVRGLRRGEAVVILAHPHWSGNTEQDALRHGFDGVEVYNHICHYLNGKSWGGYHWDRMLRHDPRALGLGVDDAHLHEGQPWDGACVYVAAPALDKESILAAIRAGDFYSSQGPRFTSIHVEPDRIRVGTTPVVAIRLVDDTPWGDRVFPGDGKTVTQGEFKVDREHAYLRVEIEDAQGKRAWTNALLEHAADED